MEFPRSVALHFPSEIYRSTGVSEIVPQLLRALVPEKVDVVQFLKNGRVRVTLKSTEYRDELLRGSSFLFGDVPIPVTVRDVILRSVYVRDLPFEVPDLDVQAVFQSFGVVYSVRPCFFRVFPSVANGARVLLMFFDESVQSIPSTLCVSQFPVRVWHAGQPYVCSICHESGHLPQACPFSGRCLHCKQPGHRARDCAQAWGLSRPSLPASVPVSTVTTPVSAVPSLPVIQAVSAPVSTVPSTPVSAVLPVSRVTSSASCPVLPLAPVSVPISFPAPVPPGSQVTSPASRSVPVCQYSYFSPVVVPSVSSDVEESEIVHAVSSPSDVKKLTRLTLSRMKPGSDQATVFKLVQSLIKFHKLSVTNVEVNLVVDCIFR